MQFDAQFSSPDAPSDAENDHLFDSPWNARYEVRPSINGDITAFQVIDKKQNGSLIATFKSRPEADLECAIAMLAHLKALRSKKQSGQLSR